MKVVVLRYPRARARAVWNKLFKPSSRAFVSMDSHLAMMASLCRSKVSSAFRMGSMYLAPARIPRAFCMNTVVRQSAARFVSAPRIQRSFSLIRYAFELSIPLFSSSSNAAICSCPYCFTRTYKCPSGANRYVVLPAFQLAYIVNSSGKGLYNVEPINGYGTKR